MQAASDILLGWSSIGGYHYYFRQLWDMKGSFDTSLAGKSAMQNFGNLCGWTLARAHARSGDRIAIARYLGKGESFDTAIADFATRYADQAERDYEAFMAAADSGRIELDTSANK
jgi:predicted alpha/beta hydrolase